MTVIEIRPGPQAKYLKDYPFKTWIRAADGCEYCGQQYEIMITWIDETGKNGDINARIQHKPTCPHVFNNIHACRATDLNDPQLTNEETTDDFAGWEFAEKTRILFGKEWLPIKTRANVGPCLNCWRLIVGVPLILFIDEGRGGEIDLCMKCAADLGVLSQIINRGPCRPCGKFWSEKCPCKDVKTCPPEYRQGVHK